MVAGQSYVARPITADCTRWRVGVGPNPAEHYFYGIPGNIAWKLQRPPARPTSDSRHEAYRPCGKGAPGLANQIPGIPASDSHVVRPLYHDLRQ